MVRTEEASDSETTTAVPRAEAQGCQTRRPWRMYLSVGPVTLLIVVTMVYSLRTGGHMTEVYAPLVDATMEIKLEAALGHLWFEEVISGDRHEDIASALNHLDQSEWYARAMLEGGRNPEGTFVPLKDSGLRREIEEVLRKIADFRAIAEERFAAKEKAAIGTDIDQRFDAVFEDFLAQADRVETRLQLLMASKLQRFRTVQAILIAACVALAALVATVLSRYDRERKRALLGLHKSEERYRAIAEDMPVLICRFLPGGEITYVNDAYCRYFEKTPEELVGQTFLLQIPEAGRETVMANISALTIDSPTQSHEHQVIAAGGETRWQRWTNQALFGAEGQAVAYQSSGEDITERKRAEEALRRSVDLQQIFLDSMPPVAMLLRPNTQEIVACNSAGRKVGAVPGKTCFETWGQSDTPCPWCLAPKLWATGQAQHLQPEGLGRVWDAHWIPVAEDLYLHYAYDITERKRAEEELAREKRRLEQVTESAGCGLLLLDEHTRVTYANKLAQEWFGALDQIQGKDCCEVFELADPENGCAAIAVLRTGEAAQGATFTRVIDGEEKSFHVISSPVKDSRGEIQQITEVVIDLTEHKQAEEALRESEAKYRAHVEDIPAITYMAGIDDASPTQYISPQVQAILGLSPAAWLENPGL